MSSACSKSRREWLTLTTLGSLLPSAAWALAAPSQRVVLSISGRISLPNHENEARFDMSMLAALPQRSLLQKTPWYPQARKFTGPLLRDVLTAAGAQGETLEAVAINDYKVSIPTQDCRQHEVVLARLLDDKPMSLRDKGPLFIIYPFEQEPRLRNSVYYSRCAWQLKSLDVR